ncbi:hypothetical protein AYL99_06232 [Fonsecaea erecta]|uniref:Prolyl 4-hydroxylase alpha subunit Fe(2+) 2OG dioxygenase domain-containing protein n=1 Tax=Fonsecaea erecta TaxID=1367422 RepID=A0A178ZIR2_9EURO|nr:hypothetical protein AYL99_06232 [Fonsecaea erecta]OAP58935.1 hypothetical protein AYL99_06232 [Fonsecaea erecta]
MESDEDYSEEEDYLEPLRRQITGCLSGIHSAGSFATSDNNVEHIHPGLTVKGVGPIRLPLSHDDAQALIKVSLRAPFGKGRNTLVDETVRKTWEIDGKELSFENEKWDDWLKGVLGKVSEGLGIPGDGSNVQAELYKLLVYEEGAFFKPHKDTEKTHNMFGTLVICLPSQHVGGGVRLIHGKEETVLETDKGSAYGVSYLAWYSDVSHEVLPVQSGYRLVLTYNLAHTGIKHQPSATVLDMEQSRIGQMLDKWSSMKDRPQFMCYALRHKYTAAHLQLANLKGDDYYRCFQLDQACQSNGHFCVLLSRMKLTVTRINDEDEYDDSAQEELRLEGVVTLQGFKLRDALKISDTNLVPSNLYDDRQHDEQWGGEHLGNQHAEISQVYRDTVALIAPRDIVTQLLLGRGHKLEQYWTFLQRLLTGIEDEDSDERSLFCEMLVQTCQNHIQARYPTSSDKDRHMGFTALASLRFEDFDMAMAALDAVTDSFDTYTFESIGQLGFQRTKEFVTEAFSRMSKLHLVDRGLRAFRSGVSKAAQPDTTRKSGDAVHKWAVATLRTALDSIKKVSAKDAGAVVQIMAAYEDKPLWKRVDAFIGRFLAEATFLGALLSEVLCYSRTGEKATKSHTVVEHLVPLILDRAISYFRLEQFSSFSKRWEPAMDHPFSLWPGTPDAEKGKKDAAVVASLYRLLAEDDLDKAAQLLEKIADDTRSVKEDDLNRFIIPLLREMIDVTALQPAEASRFYRQIITTYSERVVQKEPPKPQDWSQPDAFKPCWNKCEYCSLVQEFLMDPSKEEQVFAVPAENYYSLTQHWSYHCERTLEEKGKIYEIRVRKTLGEWEKAHKSWGERAGPAQSKLRSLPEAPLRQYLGDGEYEDLMDLRIVKVPTGGDVTMTTTATTPAKAGKGSSSHTK